MNVLFLLIPIIYVIISQVANIINLFAFHFMDDDVIIHWPGINISGSSKTILIILSFFGFIAIDILYTRLIMRYAFQCKMNIYFLEEITMKIGNLEVIRSSTENDRNIETYENQDDALKDIKRAQKFLRQLNQDSSVVGFIILIATLQATNSIINLSDEGNTYFQTVALAVRLTHWVFLALFPIYEVAQTNSASKKLRDTGLAIYILPVQFDHNTDLQNAMIREHVSPVSLKAKLFGITVHPSYPYVILILILFTLVLGPRINWYERFI